jgi:hypothetical protein
MSIQNLNFGCINSLDVPCVLSDGATGSATINLKRINDTVFCHVPEILFTANNTTTALILTPSITIPAYYFPLTVQFGSAYMNNNSNNQIGSYTVNASLVSLFFGTANGAANFNNACAIWETNLIWKVNDFQ